MACDLAAEGIVDAFHIQFMPYDRLVKLNNLLTIRLKEEADRNANMLKMLSNLIQRK
ncbi:hypothetical protein Voja6_00131 [Pseudomonas phage vB_PpuM-Voja-6]